MLYIALGDSEEWSRFAKPKPIRWNATSKGDNLVFEVPPTTWYARESCTITHWYILSDTYKVLRRIEMPRTTSVRAGDSVEVVDCAIECYGPMQVIKDNEPYLV